MKTKKQADPKEYNELVQAASLERISLQRIHAECFIPPMIISPDNTKISFTSQHTHTVSDDQSVLICFVELGVSAMRQNRAEGEAEAFSIKIRFALYYSIGLRKWDDRSLELFSKLNASFNAHPYFREHLQRATQDMGVPVITLPLIKVAPAKADN